jgi:ABC-type sugar transport system substrate-binding protein
MRAVFLAPSLGVEHSFYDVFAEVAGAAARQLHVDFETIGCGGSAERFLECGRTLARQARPPGYVLLPDYMDAGRELVPALDEAGLQVLLVAEGLSSAARAALGGPRQKHPHWLGEILPDDTEAGYLLAKALARAAREGGLAAGPGKLQVGILSGDQSSAGLARFRGWARLKTEDPGVEQASFQYAAWERDKAKSATTLMLRSQPQIGLVWAANDAMALGALEAACEAGRVPGKDILLGGIDLGHEALVAVSEGSLAVSIGGHFLDGARALLLAHDHHHGRDFEPWSRRSPLVSATPESAARYRRFVEARGWREVDFTRFSRTASPHGEPPDFTLDSILGQSRPRR